MECGCPRRGKVRVYTPCSQAPHRQGQKLEENETDMCVPPEENTSKRVRSAGHCPLPFYIMDKTLVACWRRFVRRARRKLFELCEGGT